MRQGAWEADTEAWMDDVHRALGEIGPQRLRDQLVGQEHTWATVLQLLEAGHTAAELAEFAIVNQRMLGAGRAAARLHAAREVTPPTS